MSVGLRVGVELLSALIVGGAGGIANVWRLLGPKPPAH